MSSDLKVLLREPDLTEMWVAPGGPAKAFLKQLLRDGKEFHAEPGADGWVITVYEVNEPSRWELM